MVKYNFGFEHKTALRLSHVVGILKHTRVIEPVPTRQGLINMILDGTLQGKQTNFGYVIYEESLHAWVKSLQPEAYELIPKPTLRVQPSK